MLRYQLNPHFLFNTLNAISTLILDNQGKVANQAVGRLSEFLRYTLDQDPMKKVTLRQEMDALNLYLGIEQLRFGDRLQVRWDLDAAAERAKLPPLILQPLVENALKHGIEPKVEGGEVKVSAREEQGRLLLEVADTGRGAGGASRNGRGASSGNGEGSTTGMGVGLANVRERLAVAFPGARFEAGPNPAGGYTVRLSIPR